jgi:hypothetical protein
VNHDHSAVSSAQAISDRVEDWREARQVLREGREASIEVLDAFASSVESWCAGCGDDPLTGRPIFTIERDTGSFAVTAVTGQTFRVAVNPDTAKVAIEKGGDSRTADRLKFDGSEARLVRDERNPQTGQVESVEIPLATFWNSWIDAVLSQR